MNKKILVISLGILITLTVIISSLAISSAADKSSKSDNTEKAIQELKKELQDLKKDMQDLKAGIEDIKTKLTARPPAQPPQEQQVEAIVSVDDDPYIGSEDAPVTIIEFSDFQCPFCGRNYKTTLPEIKKEYISTGKVKYVFRDFPLEFHKNAPKASEAANCAGDQDKYWEMHDKLFDNQNAIMVENLKQYAVDIGLQADTFNSCLDSGKYAEEINRDLEDGKKAGVTGTPSFYIGKTKGKEKEVLGKKITGARPYASFKQVIDQLLAEPAK